MARQLNGYHLFLAAEDAVFTTRDGKRKMEDGRGEGIGKPGNRYGDGLIFVTKEGGWEKDMS